MINPVSKVENSDSKCLVNIANLVGSKQEVYKPEIKEETDSPDKKGRTKKSETINMTKSKKDETYYDKYAKTNALLDQTIFEIDDLNAAVKKELKVMTASKTIKNKYNYISELAGTSGSLIATKVTAIRELNKSITDAANLEIRMARETKEAEDTDDKRIMDMYNAFINTPVGSYSGPIAPSNVDMVLGNTGIPITPMTKAGELQTDDIGYDQYINNLSAEQRKIQLEGQSNIKLAVVFDPDTGNRYFDNVNLDTGESVPGLPIPEPHFLDDVNINMNTGVARNTNLNITYPVVLKHTGANFTGF